ncbi:MAG: hypothetical protein Q7J35_14165, partial [Candidatus Methanoperedens sp.]|nr:hypothetical protein [Candidatus Methanoperedens sp.]
MNNKILIMLSVVMILSSPALAIPGNSGTPVTLPVSYIVNVDTSFTVTINGPNPMTFNASQHCGVVAADCIGGNPRLAQNVPANGQPTNPNGYANITNNGGIAQDFYAQLDVIRPNIVTSINKVNNAGTATALTTNPKKIWGGVATGETVHLFGYADFNAASIGTSSANVLLSSSEALLVTSIVVLPNPGNVTAGLTLPFSATAYDQYGTAMPGETGFVWNHTSGNAAGSINVSTGLYTAAGVGGLTDTATATIGTVSGTAIVNVRAAPVATTLSVTPAGPITINTGELQTDETFTATLKDQYGATMAGTFTWAIDSGPGSIS